MSDEQFNLALHILDAIQDDLAAIKIEMARCNATLDRMIVAARHFGTDHA